MLVQLMLLLFCQTIIADPLHKPFYDTNDFEAIGRTFESFLETHNKVYDEKEKVQRFVIFIENVMKINELNSLYEETLFDINHLTDWSEEELESLRGFKIPEDGSNLDGDCKVLGDPTTKDAPEAFDWRKNGVVLPAENQGSCGSCWAFSATGLVESRSRQKTRQTESLSKQQLVDCDTNSGGCEGGLMSLALTHLMQSGGQQTEADYPYEQMQLSCRFDKRRVAARVLNCTDYNLTSEEALKELLFKEGPLAIALDAGLWSGYSGGISRRCGFNDLNHGVLLVGYGSENGVDFWVIKNSWGLKFGEQGFIRIQRGVKCNGIAGIGQGKSFACTSATIA